MPFWASTTSRENASTSEISDEDALAQEVNNENGRRNIIRSLLNADGNEKDNAYTLDARKLRLASLNANGLAGGKLATLLNNYILKKDIKMNALMLQETHIKSGTEGAFVKTARASQCDMINSMRDDGYGGSAIITAQKSRGPMKMGNARMQITALTLAYSTITIVSVYWRPQGATSNIQHAPPEDDVETLRKAILKAKESTPEHGLQRLIVCGDFNTELDAALNQQRQHYRREAYVGTMEGLGLIRIPTNECTFVPTNDSTRTTTPDHVWATPDIAERIDIQIDMNRSLSDHAMIIMEVDLQRTNPYRPDKAGIRKIPNWTAFSKFNQEQQENWMEEIAQGLSKEMSSPSFAALSKLIDDATRRLAGERDSTRPLDGVRWWNNDCTKKVKSARKIRRNLTKARCRYLHIMNDNAAEDIENAKTEIEELQKEWQKAKKESRHTIALSRITQWRNECDRINKEPSPPSSYWRRARACTGKRTAAGIIDGTSPKDMHAYWSTLAQYTECPRDAIWRNDTNKWLDEHVPNYGELDFSVSDIREAIGRTARKAYGPDNIAMEPYKVFSKHEKNSVPLQYIAKLYSRTAKGWITPEEGVTLGRVVTIPKVLHPTSAAQYRPITLSNFAWRIYGKLLSMRLIHEMENAGSVADEQGGFRRARDAPGQGALLYSMQKQLKDQQGTLLGVMLDLKKAFDCVPTEAMCHSLTISGMPTTLIHWAVGYARTKRTALLATCPEEPSYKIMRGTPQGDPASPSLFLLFINSLIKRLTSSKPQMTPSQLQFGVIGYADDITMLTTNERRNNRTIMTAEANMRLKAQIAHRWAKEHKMEFGLPKCEWIHLGKRANSGNLERTLTMGSETIPRAVADQATVLGLLIKGARAVHASPRLKKAHKALSALSGMMEAYKGVAAHHGKTLLTSTILQTLLYGCETAALTAGEVKAAYKLQKQGMRSILSAFPQTPTCAMERDLAIRPLQLQIDRRVIRFVVRTCWHATPIIQRAFRAIFGADNSYQFDIQRGRLTEIVNRYHIRPPPWTGLYDQAREWLDDALICLDKWWINNNRREQTSDRPNGLPTLRNPHIFLPDPNEEKILPKRYIQLAGHRAKAIFRLRYGMGVPWADDEACHFCAMACGDNGRHLVTCQRNIVDPDKKYTAEQLILEDDKALKCDEIREIAIRLHELWLTRCKKRRDRRQNSNERTRNEINGGEEEAVYQQQGDRDNLIQGRVLNVAAPPSTELHYRQSRNRTTARRNRPNMANIENYLDRNDDTITGIDREAEEAFYEQQENPAALEATPSYETMTRQ